MISGISVVHATVGEPQHFLIRYEDGKCDRFTVTDAYALRLGSNLIEGAVTNLNSRKENLT